MTDTMITTLFEFLVLLIAVVVPIIKLTSNVTEIKTILERFETEYKDSHKKLEARVSKHGDEIDDLAETVIKHEVRIESLERGEHNDN